MRRPKTGIETWHVIARGARRLFLYHETSEFHEFLRILDEAVQETGCTLVTYAILANHYHLLIRGTSEELTRCMHRTNLLYSKYHNKRHGLVGHAFDGPYLAFPKHASMILVRCATYILLNPVRAGIVKRAGDYRWSSYWSYLGLGGSPLGVNPKPVLSVLDSDLGRARMKFQALLERKAKRKVPTKKGIPTAQEIHQEQFRWLLEDARQQADIVGREDPVKVAMYWGRERGIQVSSMARVLQHPNPRALSKELYRFSRSIRDNPERRDLIRLS